MGRITCHLLWLLKMAIESQKQLIYPLNMMFHSYVSLPEGISRIPSINNVIFPDMCNTYYTNQPYHGSTYTKYHQPNWQTHRSFHGRVCVNCLGHMAWLGCDVAKSYLYKHLEKNHGRGLKQVAKTYRQGLSMMEIHKQKGASKIGQQFTFSIDFY